MARQLYHFVAGEQHTQAPSASVLDAWLAIEIKHKRGVIASEFLRLPIEAYDQDGNLIATKRWDEWHADVMRDTYGEDWKESVARAQSLG